MSVSKAICLAWNQIETIVKNKVVERDLINGKTSSQALLRLFGGKESDVRVTLYRDHHAWCPYCQKIWVFLEESRIPYRVRKVTMFCYGEKEAWYKKIVPSGMLPAIELDGQIITESDRILTALEEQFGPLYRSMQDKQVYELRKLERKLFNAWCRWLCYPSRNITEDNASRDNFISVLKVVDQKLLETPGPYFLADFSVVDSIFIPYVERMHASLFYYKGFSMRDKTKFPGLTAWFSGIESRDTYMGTQSDFHTHVHDLPPQMGGCYENGTKDQEECKNRVDSCTDFSLPESSVEETEENKYLAADRVLKFKDYILQVNPCKDETIDEGLRCTLTYLLSGQLITPPPGSDVGLRYIKERINVPRDMSLWSARRLREALELTAAAAGSGTGQPIPSEHRRDQNPANFGKI